MEKNKLYRKIPKVDYILEEKRIQSLIEENGKALVMSGIREEIEGLRKLIECEDEESFEEGLNNVIYRIEKNVKNKKVPRMKSVINGTGTILHTNLGRAPIGEHHLEQVRKIATGYSNLEYDLERGKRGERYSHFEKFLCELTGAEAAMAVNNNASAVLLILSAMGSGKEVVVSRGEMVEVGGKFRIPDVMKLSGSELVEIGTTNKTHLEDYAEVANENTGAFLKVHTSNYRIIGFTDSVSAEDLVTLGREKGIPVIEDLGSGVLIDLSKYGLNYEPTVQDSIEKGVDVVCFSGDKLLGGPQAGIIVGKKEFIDKMKKNPLTRAVRIDKFTAAALEVVLKEYLSEEMALKNIPVLHMITKSEQNLEEEASMLENMLKEAAVNLNIKKIKCESQIGGGSLPLERLASYGVSVSSVHVSANRLEELMRKMRTPIIPRIINDEVVLDVRTIGCNNFEIIVEQLKGIGR